MLLFLHGPGGWSQLLKTSKSPKLISTGDWTNFFFQIMLIGNRTISNHICYMKLETSELGWFVPGKILTWILEPALENTTQLVDLALETRTDTPSSYQGSFWGFIEHSVLKKFKSWFWYINIVLKFFWEKKKKKNSHKTNHQFIDCSFFENHQFFKVLEKTRIHGSSILLEPMVLYKFK